jgi:hypothetical protein
MPYLYPDNYNDKTANGLTKCIIAFLNLSGHFAERINTMGRVIGVEPEQRDVMGKVQTKAKAKYIPTTGEKGSADISSTIKVSINGMSLGLSVKWEVKIKKDRQSEDQKKYEQRTTDSGGYYFIVRTYDDFMDQYEQLFSKFN